MKKLMTAAVAVALGASAFADTFYVDPTGGTVSSDDYDGSAETWQGGTVGPMKTLAAVAAKAGTVATKSNPCTIIALPGEYREGLSNPEKIDTGTTLVRVAVPAYVTLKSRDGREKTFIIGEASTAPDRDKYDNGMNGVRCAQAVNADSKVIGFTLTNGHTNGSDGGGGSYGSGVFEDCILSNNYCHYRGAGGHYVTFYRCRFLGNYALDANGTGCDGSTCYSCLFDRDTMYQGTSYCCTFRNADFQRGGTAYFGLALADWSAYPGGQNYYNCVGSKVPTASSGTMDVIVTNTATHADATGCPLKTNYAVDHADYDLFTNKVPVAYRAYDVDGRPRVNHGRLDFGACEMDWGEAFSRDLATMRVRVTEFADAVHETADGKVAVPSGAALSLVWARADGAEGELDYSFTAAIPSGAALKVYRDGAVEPTWTMDEATEMPFTWQAGAEQAFRFVAEGGEVVLSDFYDCGVVDITDSSTGLTVEGAEKGRTELEPGASATVRISRNFTSEFTVSGFTVNGEFVAFDDHADDWVWERVVSGPASSIRVEAVYPTTKAWYVDPVKGNDGNDGRTKTRAVRTLVAAAKLVGTTSTTRFQPKVNTIYLAEGTYAEGIYTNAGAYARGYVPNHTRLVGLGDRAKTIILGAKSDTPDAGDATALAAGCGPGAVRCLYMGIDSFVRGVTLTGGRSPKGGSSGALIGYGYSSGCWMIDCIATNNYCDKRGGVSQGGPSALRCYFADNFAPTAGSAIESSPVVNCVFNQSSPPLNVASDYNCTFVQCSGRNKVSYEALLFSTDSYSQIFTNSILRYAYQSSSKGDEATLTNVGATGVVHAADYTPLVGSLAIDYGRDGYLERMASFKASLSDPFNDLDFTIDYNGRPRVIGERVDVGACEYDWRTDPPKGLALVLTDRGDGTTEVAVSRNFTSAKPAVGFSLGEETVMFDELDGKTWTKTFATDDLQGLMLKAVYNENPTDWYVDAVNGDDANPGYLPDCPKHTLTGIVACASSGHIVHAAPGVYREGAKKNGDTWTRVIIPAGVGLVAEGDGEHVIEGVISKELGHSGPDSVRCVYCGTGAWVKGFTIRNGSTRVGSNVYGDTGGGIIYGTAIDCVITNCYAVRGGGSSGATLIRCILKDCYVETGATNANGNAANTTAPAMEGGKAFDSWITGETLNVTEVRNCRCEHLWHNSGYVRAYNSVVTRGYGGIALTNCVMSEWRDSFIRDDGTVTGKTIAFDANCRPVAGQTLAIDRGKAEYYVYPAAFAHEQGVADIAGGQRVYNGAIDIGPGEYDWRGDFAKKLRRGVSVETASANVTTNAVAGLDLKDGEMLEFTCTAKTDGKVSFRVTGAGTVTVTYGGEPLEPVEGVYSVRMDAGTSEVFAVSYAGEGVATVNDVVLPHLGSLLLIR